MRRTSSCVRRRSRRCPGPCSAFGARRIASRRAGIEFAVSRAAIRVRVVAAMGQGYGHPTVEGERATRLAAEHGLQLDPTYGAKAFSVFVQRADLNVKRAVFWTTFAWP